MKKVTEGLPPQDIVCCKTCIILRLDSINQKVRDPCPMSRLSYDSDAIGKTDI